MKLRVEVDGRDYILDIRSQAGAFEYTLKGENSVSGASSVLEISPGVFSVLMEGRSFTVHIASRSEELEAWTASEQHIISVADTRDRAGRHKRSTISGPLEVRAQMPGKVIRLLVKNGTAVQAGQGLIVVEAMKMQNEMKSPKEGTVSRINVMEGATVAAGQTLVVVE